MHVLTPGHALHASACQFNLFIACTIYGMQTDQQHAFILVRGLCHLCIRYGMSDSIVRPSVDSDVAGLSMFDLDRHNLSGINVTIKDLTNNRSGKGVCVRSASTLPRVTRDTCKFETVVDR